MALVLIIYLMFWVAPEHGTENVLVYLAICSLAGSFTVTSCKVCLWLLASCAMQLASAAPSGSADTLAPSSHTHGVVSVLS